MRVLGWTGPEAGWSEEDVLFTSQSYLLAEYLKSPASQSDFECIFLPPQVFHLNPETILSSRGVWKSAGFRIFRLQCFQITVPCVEAKCMIWSPSLVKLNSPHDHSMPAAALHSKGDGNALLPFRVYIMNSTWSYRTPLSTHSNSKILSGLNFIAERNLGDLCCSPIFW